LFEQGFYLKTGVHFWETLLSAAGALIGHDVLARGNIFETIPDIFETSPMYWMKLNN